MNADLVRSKQLRDGFAAHLRLERGLAENSVEAYCRDAGHFFQFLSDVSTKLEDVTDTDIHEFLATLHELGIQPRSQARILAGLRAFFRYLRMERVVDTDPTELVEAPRVQDRLPDVLTVEEIDAMTAAIDPSKPESVRNHAIIETLYGSGLRVSELVGLQISRINFSERYLLVEGKGSRQRLVPLSDTSLGLIEDYLESRLSMNVRKGDEDILFLNRRGARLSRIMVFYIVKNLAEVAGIKKNVSPHTIRHSFATHLLEGGANLRAIQEMLGHESIATTEIYVHLDRSHLREELLTHHPHYSRH